MTQKQEANSILQKISKTSIFSQEWAHQLNLLDDVVGRAQNRKPLGEADGSINESMWNSLRDYVAAARASADNHNIMLATSKQLLVMTAHRPTYVRPQPEPVYDDIYHAGVAALDSDS